MPCSLLRRAALLPLIALGGCDLPLGIGDGWVEGEWLWEGNARGAGGLACTLTGVTLVLAQDGSRFSGTASGGSVTCVVGLEAVGGTFGTRVVTGGETDGDAVSFGMGAGEISARGTLEGDSMSGDLVWRVDLGALGVQSLSGTFAGARVAGG